jgi:monothiol glutaredoxin
MQWVNSNDVCLFMKGSPKQPQCGYSKYVATALSMQGIMLIYSPGLKDYFSYDVLSNPIVREQLKVYSKWPTFPQLYVKGKLVGGCDIVKEMATDGSLQKLLKDNKMV